MRRSRMEKRFLFLNTEEGDSVYSSPLGDKDPVPSRRMNSSYSYVHLTYPCGQRSRKRPRSYTSLPTRNRRNEEQTGNANSSRNDRNNLAKSRRQPAKLSWFERIIDKALLLDDNDNDSSSSDSGFSFQKPILLLAVIATTSSLLLPNVVGQVMFLILYVVFSLPALYPSLLPWEDDRDVIGNDDEDSNEFKLYSLSIGYLGALFLTYLAEPLDFEPTGLVQTQDSPLLSTTVVVGVAALGILSSSGFIDDNKEVRIDGGEDDYAVPSISPEERLLELWDEEFRKDELSDDRNIGD